ncbi:alkylated DNA repair protein (DNA oxidative demethylase) [Cribrihabitans marinus]|uniref:Alkylated DNA repair protein (DNA oxidative demethylase) n=1 Tax=Cribrihabitans marinus TaxID=1227549 RepID=A0A1H6YAK9_9RHOB|nr:alpha-ketoglutarate-dependent dioxygenase AlkB [Cribrihabitans marinus]GGH28889.1 alkylated DNA repair dioxygenase [Cribrihabitans marinus]SEJ38318.1 alkylated DNA repair protein (DNA oxidative demethylase) [Cribrihabitans marinus]
MPRLSVRGFDIHKGCLDAAAQSDILEALRPVLRRAPLTTPETRRGQKLSVRMSAAGELGWTSDRRGYRYEPRHPRGTPWPAIPDPVLRVWTRVTELEHRPDSCLINYYGADARMGLHQDRDEADLSWPVVSISLGDDALFRIGNTTRGGKTESIWLHSGDVVVMGGEARLAYHGIDRIRFGSSRLLPKGGRINLTLRVAG